MDCILEMVIVDGVFGLWCIVFFEELVGVFF